VRWNVAAAALSASWGFISIIVAGVDLSAEALVFYRLTLAAVTVAVAAWALGRIDLLQVRAGRGRVALLGLVLGVHWLLYFETIKLSSVAVAVLTVYTAPVFLALLAPLALPEGRSRVALAALVPAGAGLTFIALAGEGGTHPRPLAITAGIAAAVTYATAVILAKQLTVRLAVPAIQLWTYLVAAAVTVPFLAVGSHLAPTWEEAGYVLLLGIVFTALSGLVYVWLLRKVTAQAIGVLAYLEPVFAALLAWAILGQRLGWAIVAGGALIIVAGLLVVFYEPAEAATVAGPTAAQ